MMAMNAPAPTFRRAVRADLDTLVRLLAEDALGVGREQYSQPLRPGYVAAFDAIDRDDNNLLVVVCLGAEVVGMMQLTFVPSLTFQGGWRASLDGVRIAQAARSPALGQALIAHAVAVAKARGCHVLQLTTDKAQPQAKLFYERLGFLPSHEGMKLPLR